MDHAPFIWSSYIASAVILLWAAVAPLLKQRGAIRDIRLLEKKQSQAGDR